MTITPGDLERTFGFPVPAGYRQRYNLAPTQEILGIGVSRGARGFREYRWGLVPFWAKDLSVGNRMVNARCETIMEKSAFRMSFEKRRCLIVVDGYYEWQVVPGGKRPHRIRRTSGEPFTLAGLWARWGSGPEAVESCAIVTTPPNSFIEPIHDRMPAIIPDDDREEWLTADASTESLLGMLRPYEGSDLEAYEVSTFVNSPANDTEECIEPIELTPLPLVLDLFERT